MSDWMTRAAYHGRTADRLVLMLVVFCAGFVAGLAVMGAF